MTNYQFLVLCTLASHEICRNLVMKMCTGESVISAVIYEAKMALMASGATWSLLTILENMEVIIVK